MHKESSFLKNGIERPSRSCAKKKKKINLDSYFQPIKNESEVDSKVNAKSKTTELLQLKH